MIKHLILILIALVTVVFFHWLGGEYYKGFHTGISLLLIYWLIRFVRVKEKV